MSEQSRQQDKTGAAIASAYSLAINLQPLDAPFDGCYFIYPRMAALYAGHIWVDAPEGCTSIGALVEWAIECEGLDGADRLTFDVRLH